MAASSNSKQVFDVAKPGKSAPSPTSRPVIVNHGPMMKDPMVSDPESKEKPEEKEDAKAAASESHKVIAPLNDLEKPADKDKVAEAAETAEPADKDAAKSDAQDDKDKKKKATEQAVVDAVVDQTAKKKKSQPTEEELAKQAEVEKLIESKKYFVPIGEVTRRRNNRRLMIGLVIVLVVAAVGGYLAIDAGLLDLPVDVPVDLIKN